MNSIPQSSQQLLSCSNPNLFTSLLPKAAPPASSLPLSPASPVHPALWSTALSLTLPLPKRTLSPSNRIPSRITLFIPVLSPPKWQSAQLKNPAQSLALVSPELQALMRNLSLPALSISPLPIRRFKMFSFAAIFFRITTATSSVKKPSLLPWILPPPSSFPPAASPTLPGPAAPPLSIP